MKAFRPYIRYGLAVLAASAIFVSCEEESEPIVDNPAITLNATKVPGHGQYRLPTESGKAVAVTANVASSAPLKSLTITKTVNLQVDSDYGNNGVLTVNPSGTDFQYAFTYTPDTTDVDQLVGFTFRAENANGSISESDLTLAVTLSPRDNLPRRRWLWKSLLHVNDPDEPNKESIRECEKDNSFLFNRDGSVVMNYGTNTATGDCAFDGLTGYASWSLTDDEKYFLIKKYNVFTPDVIQTDTFRVKTLTVDRLALETDIDLTVFGAGIETFMYVYEAAPR